MAAAGTASIVEEIYNTVKMIQWTWTGGTAETVIGSSTTTNFFTGKLLFCVTVPGTSDAPADDYDVMILDKNDIDLLADGGLDRATATTESILTGSLGACANSQLELSVTGSGSSGAANGIVYLWVR